MCTANPLLLTLNIDQEAMKYFNSLRRKYFPPERNFIDAHLMLFHQLPADEESIVVDIRETAKKYRHIPLQVTQIISIGNGTAYKIECPELSELHQELQRKWARWIILQDRQRLWPHITIQNKVMPDAAKKLIAELSADFKPFEIKGTGLALWEYKNGPWAFVEAFDFNDPINLIADNQY